MFHQEFVQALNDGFDAFKAYVDHRKQENPNYLNSCFCSEDGQQYSVLSWLVANAPDKSEEIEYIYHEMVDPNVGAPLHEALKQGNTELAKRFFSLDKDAKKLNLYVHDGQRTLLSRVIAANDKTLTDSAFSYPFNPNQISGHLKLPLHEAIIAGNTHALLKLIDLGANASNKCGDIKALFPPLVLAATKGDYRCMSILMTRARPDVNERMTKHGKPSDNAMDVLCYKAKKGELGMRGIAMLLCHHANLPNNPDWFDMLCDRRKELMTEVEKYLNKHPDLIDEFYSKAHTKTHKLHQVFFPQHTFESSLRNLAGRPDMDIAYRMAILVFNKYDSTDGEKPEIYKKACFTKLYVEQFKAKFALLRNNRTEMVRDIEHGELNLKKAEAHAQEKPGSRTGRIWAQMFPAATTQGGHADLDRPTAERFDA